MIYTSINGIEFKNSEKDPQKYAQLIFGKDAKAIQQGRIPFSINSAGSVEHAVANMGLLWCSDDKESS